ncbi:MAG: CHAT domain-containing protein [Armatimonadetes bacterium]|nr:CHAT domain-containing protein [Armatimonadota bacterium]
MVSPKIRSACALAFVLLSAGSALAQSYPKAPKPKIDVQAALTAAGQLVSEDKRDEALSAYRAAAKLAQASGDAEGEALARLLTAEELKVKGQTVEALAEATAARSLFAKTGDAAQEVAAWVLAAELNMTLERREDATKAFESARDLQARYEDALGRAQTGISLAIVLGDLEPKRSIDVAQESAAVYRKSKHPVLTPFSLIVLGELQGNLGRHEEAVKTLVEAAQEGRASGLPFLTGEALAKLGAEFESVGQYSAAIGWYGGALKTAEDADDKANVPGRHMSLGAVYGQIGQHGAAQTHYRKACDLLRGTDAGPAYASALLGLGTALHGDGQDAEAKKVVSEALAIQKRLLNELGQAACLGTLGNIESDARETAEAKAHLLEAAKIFRAKGDRLNEATALNSLGGVHIADNDYAAALTCFDEAVKAYDALRADSFAATAYGNKAEALFLDRKLEAAQECYRQAVSRFEVVRAGLGELTDAKSDYLAKRVHVYRQYANVLTLLGKPDESFAVVQRMKARGLLDLMASEGLSADAGMSTEDRAQEGRLKKRAEELNARMLQEGVQNEVGAKARYAALSAELRETERQLTDFSTSLYSRLPSLKTKRAVETADAAIIGTLLPDDTALVEYAVSDYGVVSLVVRKVGGVVTINGHSRAIDVEDLQKKCSALRKACSDPKADFKDLSIDLYQVLIGPLAKDIEGKKRLIVCPDTRLWDLPFSVLMPKEGAFLIDSFEIDYAYSATTAMSALKGGASTGKATSELLVCANPDFGQATRFHDLAVRPDVRPIDTPSRPIDQPSRPIDQPSRPIDQPSRPIDQPSRPIDQPSRAIDSVSRAIDSLSRENAAPGGAIKPLPGTQREADELAKLVPGATVLTGRQAQESKVKSVAGSYRYLHFATHGFVNDASPLLSNIILAQPDDGTKDDGFLTARELYGLSLNAELVVMSACNTARGEVRSGEGMIGLTWALFVAGCPSQVVSQWAVDDASTADLMVAFYRSLIAGKEAKGKALRDATLHVRRQTGREHPYYWAPFVLVGDWK